MKTETIRGLTRAVAVLAIVLMFIQGPNLGYFVAAIIAPLGEMFGLYSSGNGTCPVTGEKCPDGGICPSTGKACNKKCDKGGSDK